MKIINQFAVLITSLLFLRELQALYTFGIVQSIDLITEPTFSVKFSPNNQIFAFSELRGIISIYNVSTNILIHKKSPDLGHDPTYAMAFSKNSSQIAYNTFDPSTTNGPKILNI